MADKLKPGEGLENFVLQHFPGAKATKASGATWGDGDSFAKGATDGEHLSIEVKDQINCSLDSWWSQTRRQAIRFSKTPVLVMRRPPAKLDYGNALGREVLAVCSFNYFVHLHNEIGKLQAKNDELQRLLRNNNG